MKHAPTNKVFWCVFPFFFFADSEQEERREMYPSSESACSCSTEGSVSHCSVLVSPKGGAREDTHVYKHYNKHTNTGTQWCTRTYHHTYAHIHLHIDHLARELTPKFRFNFMQKQHRWKANVCIRGYVVGWHFDSLYTHVHFLFLLVFWRISRPKQHELKVQIPIS